MGSNRRGGSRDDEVSDISGPEPSGTIQRKRIHEEVAGRLERMIASGAITPGERFPPERELMALFGVGRSAVREGLLLLQHRGLARVSTGERALVTLPTPNKLAGELRTAACLLLAQPGGVRNFQQARAFLEIALARHAAIHATPADIAELHRILEANRDAIDDRPRFIETDLEFHLGLARISGNALITALHTALVDWLKEQREVSGEAPHAAELAYAGHERIYKSIEAGDVEAAQQAMQDHLDDVARRYWMMAKSR